MLVLAWLFACGPTDGTGDTEDTEDTNPDVVDADGDGFGDDVDCDDTNKKINPDADEVCDFVDNDCDALVDGADPDLPSQGFRDADGDKYAGTPSFTCGDTGPKTDCDDTDPTIHPDATEGICDGVDQDCDGNGSEAAYYAGVHYPNLRQAVWEAKEASDPTVYACPGVHLENDVIYDADGLTIEGYTKNADDVVFDAEGGTGILSITGDVVVRHMTFRNGGTGGRVPACIHAIGGGLLVEDSNFEGCATAISAVSGSDTAPLILRDVSITGGDTSGTPAALDLESSNGRIELDEVTLTGANSGVSPITLTVSGFGTVLVTGGVYQGNTSGESGGAMNVITEDGDPTIDIVGAIFEDNEATEDGGGFSLSMGQDAWPLLQVEDSHFIGNKAQSGGGLMVDIDRRIANVDVTIDGSEFTSNQATQRGGGIGIYSWNGTLEDEDAEIGVELHSVTFSKNLAAESGAAIGVGVGPGVITASDLTIDDHTSNVAVFAVEDGPYTITVARGAARRNDGGVHGVFELLLVDEENTAKFTSYAFGTGADANTDFDVGDCRTNAHLGTVTATLTAAAPCP